MFVKCEIKKPKITQFVVQIKVVVQYSRRNLAIFAIYSSGKNFLTPKMVHCPKMFWRRGGVGGGVEVADINFVRKKIFLKWSGTIRKLSRFLII